jgi:hypothetical protein
MNGKGRKGERRERGRGGKRKRKEGEGEKREGWLRGENRFRFMDVIYSFVIGNEQVYIQPH